MRYHRITSIYLTALLFVVLLTSCGDNRAGRLRYEAERALHLAEKHLKDTRIKPELVDAQTLKAITGRFGQVVEFCYQALDSIDGEASPVECRELQHLLFQSSTRLSQLFYSRRRFDTCIAILNRLSQQVQLDALQRLTAHLNLGQALQASGSWDSALVVYNGVLETFYPPVDDSGEVILSLFNLPAHIFRVVDMVGDSAAVAGKFAEAERYYLDLVAGFPDTRLAAAARASLARLYDDTGQWEKELAQLAAVLDRATRGSPVSSVNRTLSTGPTLSPGLAIQIRIADIYGAKIRDLDRALKLYDEILGDLGESDSLARPPLLFKISLVKMEQGDYAQARRMLVDLKGDYPHFFAATPMVQYAIARSFELEGNWSRAEIEYAFLIENYPGSDEAMSTYLYIADRFEKQGRRQESERWYREAEQYFDELAAVGAETGAEAKALTYKADLYRQKNDWNRSAETLLELHDKYPHSEPGRRALLRASAIYRKKLDDVAAADSLIAVLKASVADMEQGW